MAATADPLRGLAPGMRVVLRHRVPGGLTDSVGPILSIEAGSVTVDTPRGLERIARTQITLAKQVPPRPSRRGAPHRAISVDDLERVMLDAWPPVEREPLGGWVLRASADDPGRPSSLLPVGDPHLSLPEAMDRAEQWYAARGLACSVSLYGPSGFACADDPLGIELLRRGYTAWGRTAVLTAATAGIATATSGAAPAPAVGVRVAVAPATGGPVQLALRAERHGRAVGAVQVGFAQVWSGAFGLRVDVEHRRRGVATVLLAAAAREAQARGIRSMWVRAAVTDAPTLALLGRLGFVTHHDCDDLRAPATSRCR